MTGWRKNSTEAQADGKLMIVAAMWPMRVTRIRGTRIVSLGEYADRQAPHISEPHTVDRGDIVTTIPSPPFRRKNPLITLNWGSGKWRHRH
jgi:hypothetical protein